MGNHWMINAECRTADPELFHSDSAADQHFAIRTYCVWCPVREDCRDLADAIERGKSFGVFGGTTSNQREKQRAQVRAQQAVA